MSKLYKKVIFRVISILTTVSNNCLTTIHVLMISQHKLVIDFLQYNTKTFRLLVK